MTRLSAYSIFWFVKCVVEPAYVDLHRCGHPLLAASGPDTGLWTLSSSQHLIDEDSEVTKASAVQIRQLLAAGHQGAVLDVGLQVEPGQGRESRQSLHHSRVHEVTG